MTSLLPFIHSALPFIAIQLYLFCLLYLIVARVRFAGSFHYLAMFLGSMLFFLSFYLLDQWATDLNSLALIQARMAVLFAVGFPALSIASSRICGSSISNRKRVWLFVAGGVLAGSHSFVLAMGWESYFGSDRVYLDELVPADFSGFFWAKLLASLAAVGLVLVPCVYQLIYSEKKDLKGKAFVLSAILFVILFLVGIITRQWWIYYVGSIFSATLFLAAVYVDIHHLNQTASFIKEALRNQVLSGAYDTKERLAELVDSLEASSGGNIEIYKMRIREVLSMLADDAIESGGDVDDLLRRNQENLSKIEKADDLETLSQVTEQEAQELSEMIINIPNQRREQVIQEVKEYISENVDADLKITAIADKFCVSKSYLTNGFKEVEGQTLNHYVNAVRIEKSKSLLAMQTVTETAFDVGFSNSNYFSTVFKKFTGKSPKEYQDQLKSGS